jgi:citrate synthase
MKNSPYLTAHEAAAELGISLATLYAYVSRGMIRSEAVSDDQRSRRYRLEDVEKLKQRKVARHNPEAVVESALHLGTPVLESSITLIDDGRLYYRGHDVAQLATERTVEEVAALIWTGDLAADFPAAHAEFSPGVGSILQALTGLTPFEKYQVILPLAAVDDPAAYDLRPLAVAQTGARILRLMVTIAATSESSGIAQALQQGWIPHNPDAVDLISAALILCADHELNVSSFTARCVASANATPYATVCAGLAALSGAKHGGYTERVEALLNEAGCAEAIYPTMTARLKRGDIIPGFGQPLYPDGDPRGRLLLQLVAERYPDSPVVEMAEAASESALKLIGDYSTVDFGLAIVARVLNLPPGSALALFAIGRTIGWIGHAIEQYPLDRLIRPRARYIGDRPLHPNQ